jgi:2,3-bisphosphoglycerate-dependent phosphoglycerate mutase
MADTTFYLLRHCTAVGQAPDAPLTPAGRVQAESLAAALVGHGVERIVSSPWQRAIDSIAPFARRLGLTLETDHRLTERALGTDLTDWRTALRATFDDPDLCYPGGESSRAATARGLAALADALHGGARTVALVTHSNLLALLLRHFDPRIGYAGWKALTNPDVFRVRLSDDTVDVERIWRPLPSWGS